ncbi:MAG: hypothetical protein IPI85_16910 [Dehalococcoidia bacterium]|jgi:hypothetical protein|uniref:hypothetical protein n=1 Tax=Candidatus Amarobacter glycogenicus TaxID=3140699 RepID=UPI002A0D88A7|nr:hypothetical protein [Dehalococcoidia bacterium]MBK6561824.1 hypothetical protein [Dehalococcoidia bacterium]MBK7330691.1 hypothetical protein [Dehalococcoidia bacterium]MBK8558580.1 hypothetical protein [Dehalococcoidia bacterium]MBK9344254.1 hypothetical protein [Dehalococcoidia bacterium]
MAELKDSAEQFGKDLMNQNLAGLMMAFTPNGMGQAMALQSQMAGGPQPSGAPTLKIEMGAVEGEDHLVDLVMGSEGNAETVTVATRWKDVAGAWKVDGISRKA